MVRRRAVLVAPPGAAGWPHLFMRLSAILAHKIGYATPRKLLPLAFPRRPVEIAARTRGECKLPNYDRRWLAFEAQLAEWMRAFERPGIEFCAGYRRIPGFPVSGFRADGLLTDGQCLVALEVEVRQTHPDTNVGKYWLLSEHHAYERVVLFHVYTPAFNSYGWRMQLGQFYARKMQQQLPFEYVLLDRRSDVDVDATFRDVTSIVGARVEREFPEISAVNRR